MDSRELVLFKRSESQIRGDCMRVVLVARRKQNWLTSADDAPDDPGEVAVNIHLSEVLFQGFLCRGLHTVPWNASDMRQLLLERLPKAQRRHRGWRIGTMCLFTFSQDVVTRPGRSGPASPISQQLVACLGRDGYELAQACDHDRRSDRAEVAGRLSRRFIDYGLLLQEAGQLLGFNPPFERLLKQQTLDQARDVLLDAFSAFGRSHSLLDWQRLRIALERYRLLDPTCITQLPPEPQV